MADITGMYTDDEMRAMITQANKGNWFGNTSSYHTGRVVLKYGKHTFNYYCQHEDGSWTNYDCKTK